jgi:hypothetical protein
MKQYREKMIQLVLIIALGFIGVFGLGHDTISKSVKPPAQDTICIPFELDLKNSYVFIDRSSPNDVTVYISIYGIVDFKSMVYILCEYRGSVESDARIDLNNYIFVRANVSEPVFK